MMVSNPLELYTVYLGWREYDVIWQVCIQTGLAWVPFVGLFYENLTRPFESQFGNAVDTSFKRVFIEFVLMCSVIMFCVYPMLPLKTGEITYKPYCAKGAVVSTPGDSGTTYDNVFQSMMATEVKVPLFYALVSDWSSGFTNALISGSIPCDTNINNVVNTLVTSHIPPVLQQQVAAFHEQCFLPAKARFNAEQLELSHYQNTLKRAGGLADLNWIGSKVLSDLYYKEISASTPVRGFNYGSYHALAVDEAVKSNQMMQPEWGYPDCETWWSDSAHGLKHQLAQTAEARDPKNPHIGELSVRDEVNSWLAKYKMNIGSDLSSEDVIAHSLLSENMNGNAGFSSSSLSIDSNSGMLGSLYKPFIQLGQTVESLGGNKFKRDAIGDILPIVQAISLFFVITFLTLIHIFGCYRLGVCLSTAFILFSLFFSNYIWMLLSYLENALLASTSTPLSLTHFGEHPLLENFMTAMYFIAPLMMVSLMSIAGIRIGGILDGFLNGGENTANASAHHGQNIASSTVSVVTKTATTFL